MILKDTIRKKIGILFCILFIALLSITGCNSSNSISNSNIFDGYTLIEVDGGNLSGHREPNVVVDIGFGDREYWAFTNEYGQLVKVVADEIILQDDDNEPVLSTGRYYRDEAKVPGTESKFLDEGHVIADSLGGVSNAYNITPQESTLNRHGDQAYMEDAIRKAGGCSNFEAIITYPNTETQIPNHYTYTYTLKGKVITDSFDNINPDEANKELNKPVEESKNTNDKQPEQLPEDFTEGSINIQALNKIDEYIIISNVSTVDMPIQDWTIVSVTGNQTFKFPQYTLKAGTSVKVGDSKKNEDVDFHWLEGNGVWNNSSSDPAELYDTSGTLVSNFPD
ncbi:MAG: lamin tail domain-containing protein [Cellulosilyticaceae bacterium]